MKISLIIAAAGSGKRFGGAVPKQYLKMNGVTVLEKALDAFCSFNGEVALPELSLSQIIIPAGDVEECSLYLENFRSKLDENTELKIIKGGAERQDSIANALEHCTGDFVLIHDGVRPFVSSEVIRNVLSALNAGSNAVIPCVKPKSTIRTAEESLDRSKLYEVQTPQGFKTEIIKRAYALAKEKSFLGTDDAGVYEFYESAVNYADGKISIVEGDYKNIKITTPEDMPQAVSFGNGYDVHRLVSGRPLMLGCTHIPYEKGLLGHSDADVLAHAMADALLGAAILPDIGRIFPDNAKETEGMAGSEILRQVAEMIGKKGYTIMMVDGTVIAEKPKLMPYIDLMRENTAKALGIDADCVSIKATTEEKMSDVSTNGMAAIATCVLVKNFS